MSNHIETLPSEPMAKIIIRYCDGTLFETRWIRLSLAPSDLKTNYVIPHLLYHGASPADDIRTVCPRFKARIVPSKVLRFPQFP